MIIVIVYVTPSLPHMLLQCLALACPNEHNSVALSVGTCSSLSQLVVTAAAEDMIWSYMNMVILVCNTLRHVHVHRPKHGYLEVETPLHQKACKPVQN